MSPTVYSWSNLPHDLLNSIGDLLQDSFLDIMHLRGVCRWWRSVVSPHVRAEVLPLQLELPDRSGQLHQFLLCQTAVYMLLPPTTEANNRSWIMKVEGPTLRGCRHLMHPFSAEPMTNLPDWFPGNMSVMDMKQLHTGYSIRNGMDNSIIDSVENGIYKVSVTSKPCSSGSYGVLAILDGELSCLKIGEKQWRVLENDLMYKDIVRFNDYFFAVNVIGVIVTVDQSSMEMIDFYIPEGIPHGEMYFVNSGDDIFLVVEDKGMILDENGYIEEIIEDAQIRFVVYKMTENGGNRARPYIWLRVEDLGNQVFVVSKNGSFGFAVQDFTGGIGNCIYFFDYDLPIDTRTEFPIQFGGPFEDFNNDWGEDDYYWDADGNSDDDSDSDGDNDDHAPFDGDIYQVGGNFYIQFYNHNWVYSAQGWDNNNWDYNAQDWDNNEPNGVDNGLSNQRIFVYNMADATIESLKDNPQHPNLFWPPPQWLRAGNGDLPGPSNATN